MRETIVCCAQSATRWSGFPHHHRGGTIDDQICRYVGADHWVADAMSGVHLCQKAGGRQ